MFRCVDLVKFHKNDVKEIQMIPSTQEAAKDLVDLKYDSQKYSKD